MKHFESLNGNSMVSPAQKICDLKHELDLKALKCPESVPRDLHGPASSGEYGPYFGNDFIAAIVPFVPIGFESHDQIAMRVPTRQVLGSSWRVWPDPDISEEDKASVVEYIESSSGINDTLYTFIPELGLYLASEGKNRVNFCRYHGIDEIPARVMIKRYPDAHRIKLYEVRVNKRYETWAILDERYAKKLNHTIHALPFLKAYGVETLTDWPGEIPGPKVLTHYESDCTPSSKFYYGAIDSQLVTELVEKSNRESSRAEDLKKRQKKKQMQRALLLLVSAFLTGLIMGMA
ncbi:conserved hypothetical protein [Vibrio nigripulchritudo SFn27]|nr:hypothetical protein [Vibrio nigripulchritudo]CCN92034.1 conserved hypothetical protein [Vibrio nigripulchritudo SFn27]CCO44068.1 conserved hypothetical protein [Vibrio nigripulchritudo SFn135]CCO56156.1 conserved hypothetical protein [Vibrio nigripulchritudo Wn13]